MLLKRCSIRYHPDPESTRGRIVTVEFDTFWLVGTYVVNAGQGLKVRPSLVTPAQWLIPVARAEYEREAHILVVISTVHSRPRQNEAACLGRRR